jgi:hypothetical protein
LDLQPLFPASIVSWLRFQRSYLLFHILIRMSSHTSIFLSLVVAGTLLGSCKPVPRSLPLISGEIDSFEDGDPVNELGLYWETIAEGGETTSTLFIDSGTFVPGSLHYMTVGGSRPFGASGSEVAGVRTLLTGLTKDGDRSIASVDVSAYDGLGFALKGTPGSYIVQLGTVAITDFDYYNTYVQLDEDWRAFKIPFELFKQEGFGKPQPWTGTDVIHIAFYANSSGPFLFGIDDVGFYSESDSSD